MTSPAPTSRSRSTSASVPRYRLVSARVRTTGGAVTPPGPADVPDDEDRAVGVGRAVLAHRAEEEPGHLAVAPGAERQQVGTGEASTSTVAACPSTTTGTNSTSG